MTARSCILAAVELPKGVKVTTKINDWPWAHVDHGKSSLLDRLSDVLDVSHSTRTTTSESTEPLTLKLEVPRESAAAVASALRSLASEIERA